MERFDLRGRRAAVAASVLALVACGRSRPAPCEQAFRNQDYALAITQCREEVASSGNVRARATLAQAQQLTGALADAEEVAVGLLDGSQAGAGERVLGIVAASRGEHDVAVRHLERALALHWYWRPAERWADAYALVLLNAQRASWQASLVAANQAVRAAQTMRDRSREQTALVARTIVLRLMGATRQAWEALYRANALSRPPCEGLWVTLQFGQLYSDQDLPAPARESFEAAVRVLAACPGEQFVASSLSKNLAWLDYREGLLDEAIAQLDGVDDSVSTLLIRARIAAKRGDLLAAGRYLDAAGTSDPDPDWQWEVEFLRAQVYEAGADGWAAAAAEDAYRKSIDQISEIRRLSPEGEGSAVSRYRAPYDGLIALLADRGRWRDVLDIVLKLDASDMLRSTVAPLSGRDVPSLPGANEHQQPVRSKHLTVDAVVEAWRGRELVILVATTKREIGAGTERAYRVTVSDGQVDGTVVNDVAAGGADQARRWGSELFANPSDITAARELGRLVVPPTASDRTLHVLLIGTLGKVPLAALRDGDGGLVIARRPLARVFSLRPRAARGHAAAPAVVLANPGGDLPAAAREGEQVAALLGVTAIQRAAATSERLWSARDADVLHIAAHVDDGDRGPELRLADRSIAPSEIVDRGLAPRIAVIAGCGAAAAQDDEGWGSLAAALLHAGSDVVIASDRTVQDDDTLALVERFYGDPWWRDDPARALAAAQVALAAHPKRDGWGAFVARTGRRGGPVGDDWAAFTALVAPPEIRP